MNMNKILAFVKQRWLILTLAVVVLIATPVMVYFSMTLQNDLRERVQKEIQADLAAITSGGSTVKINYGVPAVGNKPQMDFRFAPNESVITYFERLRNDQSADLAKVVAGAVAFNKGKRKPLIEGLFPAPATPLDESIKPREFQRLYLDLDGAHGELIRRFKAGAPWDPLRLSAELKDKQTDEVRKLSASDRGELAQLSADDQAKVAEVVRKARLQAYVSRAQTLSFYVEPSAFRLPQASNDAPTVAQCWWWQWEYWMREDIFQAVALANKPMADQGVPGSVIKRINDIRIELPFVQSIDPNAPPTAVFPLGSDAIAPTNMQASISGRIGGPGSGNNYYEVRRIIIDFVASGDRLPEFVDALAAVNFMTVVDLDLQRLDTADDLRAGYFYGVEPVVRGQMVIESVWLREWMLEFMPRDVRLGLNIPDAPTEGGDAPPPPPPGGPPPAPGAAPRPPG